jgi:predicted ferric reductase
MWLVDTAPIHSAGEWLVAVGRLTGLEATYVMLVAIVLLSRIRWIDRMVGMDRLFRWHARVSAVALWLIVAHALAIIWGYSTSFSSPLLHETRVVILDLPDVLAATTGLGLLVAVGLTSTKRLRRRLRYETWHFIHLYVYLAVVLSFSHQFSTGFDFATHALNRAIWIAMYALTFGALAWYRVLVPLYQSISHDLRVAAVEPEANGVVSMYVTGSDLLALRAKPGQFFIWRILSRNHWWEAHPFSISQVPSSSNLRVTVGAAGDFTQKLSEVRPGTRVIAEGPFGSFTWGAHRGTKILLIAAGSGIGPIRGILEKIPREFAPILIYRAGDSASAALRGEIEEIARNHGATVHFLFGSRSEHGELTDPEWLRHIIGANPATYDVFMCGPEPYMREVRNTLISVGVPNARLHYERFAT